MLFNPDGDAAFCSSDAALFEKFDASSWWTPLFIFFFIWNLVLTFCLVFCRFYFHRYKKGKMNFVGNFICVSSLLNCIYCLLAMPRPLLTPEESTRILLMFFIYSIVVSLMNTIGLLTLRDVQQISSFDVTLKLDIPQLRILRIVQAVFGIFPPYLAPGVILIHGFNKCHIPGDYLRVLAAFIALPQITTAVSWVVFGTLAYVALSRQIDLQNTAASGIEWTMKLKQIRKKILAAGIISGMINILGFIPNAFAAYTFLMDESPAFHYTIRILGVVFMLIPFTNHLVTIYGPLLWERGARIRPVSTSRAVKRAIRTKGIKGMVERTEMSTHLDERLKAKEKPSSS